MNKVLGLLTAMCAIVLMAVGVQAATYSAGVVAPTTDSTSVTVPVKVTPDDEEEVYVNGYIVKLTYDSTKVAPVVSATDVLGEDCYAAIGTTFNTDKNIMVSKTTTDDEGNDVLIISWASKESVAVTEAAELAVVEFDPLDDSGTGVSLVGIEVVALTSDGESDDTDSVTVASGAIGVYGDADGTGNVTGTDASLAIQQSAQITVLEDVYFMLTDVDGDGKITGTDASLIVQKSAQLIDSFPVED